MIELFTESISNHPNVIQFTSSKYDYPIFGESSILWFVIEICLLYFNCISKYNIIIDLFYTELFFFLEDITLS